MLLSKEYVSYLARETVKRLAASGFIETKSLPAVTEKAHAAMLEEAYLYVDMPRPGFGVQLVYTSDRDPELATIVREAPKVGRNDPCPCGSGKKYKKCHGVNAA